MEEMFFLELRVDITMRKEETEIPAVKIAAQKQMVNKIHKLGRNYEGSQDKKIF